MEKNYTNPVDALAAKYGTIVFFVLLAVTMVLAFSSAYKTSVTVDEYAQLPIGIAVWKAGAFYLDAGVPPLPRVLSAVPVLLSGRAHFEESHLTASTTGWNCGSYFLQENPRNYHSCFMTGRLVPLLALLLLFVLTRAFAKNLYGQAGSLLASVFACFSPDLIAHGRLITTDIFLAAAIVGSLLIFDAFFRKNNLQNAVLLGAAVGIAILCKFTAVFLLLFMPLAALLMGLMQRVTRYEPDDSVIVNGKTALYGLLSLAVAFLVINAGYMFQGTCTVLGKYEFSVAALKAVQSALPAWLPVPFPYWFIKGFDVQMAESGYTAYLLGRINETGFWNYYLVGFLVKTPFPALLAVVIAFFLKKRISVREIPLVFTCAAFFILFSLTGHKNIGIRYLLFLIPLACVWTGRIAVSDLWRSKRYGNFLAGLSGAAALSMLTGVLLVWPYYLAYFNLPSGGPKNGHRYLLDSNLDWGQDLITLRTYMALNNISTVNLAYSGHVKPEVYGISYSQFFVFPPPEGWVVISSNLLWGRMFFINGTTYWPEDPDTYAYFRKVKPAAVLGYNLYVFKPLTIKQDVQ
jgi:hypothetical protein